EFPDEMDIEKMKLSLKSIPKDILNMILLDKKRNKTLVNRGSKGKEKVFEDEENQGIVTIYKRAMVHGKSKMVEVKGAVKTGRDRGVVIGGKEKVVKVESE
nr:hypothetical protein [Tanacetum cinerariifolium]